MNRDGMLAAAENVSLRRSGRTILDGVDLTVASGEIVTLIGPNGGGKSTLVKVLLGLEKPDTGRVTRRDGLRIGYVPQKLSLDWTLPLRVSRLMTLTRRASRAEMTAALAETGAEHLIDRPASRLSGGEFQRVALARALLGRPDLLVLDEPVQGVDFAGEAALYGLIAAIRSRHGCGILLVSHDLHVVMRDTDRVICLNTHVCCAGGPDTVTQDAEYRRLFGPQAAAAFAVYTHHHDHTHGTGGGGEPAEDSQDRHHHHHHG